MTRHQKGRFGLFTAVATFALAALLAASSCGKDEKKDDKKAGATGGSSSGDTDDGPAESVSLTWDAPAADDVVSYKIYVAADKQSKGKLVTSVPTNDADFDADSPSADLKIANEAVLEDMLGEKACFSVTALNAAGGESSPSEKVCVEL
jgi:hypothetical protein